MRRIAYNKYLLNLSFDGKELENSCNVKVLKFIMKVKAWNYIPKTD